MEYSVRKYLAFLKTAEHKSFTRAAEALSCSQSGISRMIHDVEEELGFSLLSRNCSGVRLTAEGEKILPKIRELSIAFENIQNQAEEIRGIESGMIRIGTFSSVATHWLPNIIRKFQQDYPYIDYEFLLGDYQEIEQWIADGRVDLGFLKIPAAKGLDAAALEQDKLMVILPENHPLAGCKKFPIARLCDEPFILLEKEKCAEISELFAEHHLTPKVHFTTWDDYAVMSMVESGMGIGILPQLILKRIPYRIIAKELDVAASRVIGVALRSRKDASPAVKKFLEYLSYRNSEIQDITNSEKVSAEGET
ncbi:MAG: LysR family transcriptional regulator [Methanocorpusculum parvum]|nr:LysR family transcriptional regulator [Methanocorpusculum parvum]